MPLRTTHHTTTTTTPRKHGGLFSWKKHTTARHHGTSRPVHHQAPAVHHQKRHASIGDKISGAMLRLKGTLTGHSGEKAAGTRRMRGTDGRGSHRTSRFSSRRQY